MTDPSGGIGAVPRPAPAGLTIAIAVFALAMIAMIWSGVLVWVEVEKKQHIEAVKTANANLARTFEEHTVRTMNYVDQVVLQIEAEYAREGAKTDLLKLWRNMRLSHELINNLLLTDAHDNVVFSMMPFDQVDLSDREHINMHHDPGSKQLFIGKPVFGRVNKRWSMVVTRRITKPDGSFGGVAAVAVDPLYFSNFYKQVDLGRNGVVALIGRDGIVRSRLSDLSSDLGQDVRNGEIFKYFGNSPYGSLVTDGNIDGVRRIYSYRSVRGYPLIVTVGVTEEGALAETYQRRDLYYLIAAAATLLLAIGSLWLMTLAARLTRYSRALEEHQERFTQLAENIQEVFWLSDPGKSRMFYVSPGYERIWGRSCASLYASPREWLEGIHPDDRQRVLDAALARQMPGEYDEQYRIVRPDGEIRWIRDRAFPVRDAQGRVSRVAGLAEDITEHWRGEQRLLEMNQALELRAGQLAAAYKELESFTYTISHDLRAPLRHIDGFVNLLEARAAATLDAGSKQLLGKISHSATVMGRLIDGLLKFARIGRANLHPSTVVLGGVIGDIIRERSEKTGNRTIKWQVGALPTVYGDTDLLRIAFGDLVDNALKFTGRCEQAVIEIGSSDAASNEVVVFVRDNGAGFDMKYAHKLFGVFQRLHHAEEFEGVGIGLASVRRIVQRHGGRVWAEGEVGNGAVFFIALPVAGDVPRSG